MPWAHPSHTPRPALQLKPALARPQSALARILGPLANSGEAAGQSLAPAPGISGLVEPGQGETAEPAAPPPGTAGARRQPLSCCPPMPTALPGHPVTLSPCHRVTLSPPAARPCLPAAATLSCSRPTVSSTWKEI